MEKQQVNCMNKNCGARTVGTCLDGIRCPVCNDLVLPVPYDGIPGHINYSLFRKNNRPKYNKGLSLELSVDTENITAKLHAIAKHAKALADELDEVDSSNSVGSKESVTTLYADGVPTKAMINEDNKLLVIELDSEESTPSVFYEGKEVSDKVRVTFNWETKTHEPRKINFNIEHYEKNEKGEPIKKGIGMQFE